MTEANRKHVGIIGAGAGGLAAAYDLANAGYGVTVYEGAPAVGGLAAGFKAPHWDWTLEKFYHHWFQSDKSILGLIDELGWRDDVIFERPFTMIYYKDRFEPFDSPVTVFKFLLRHFGPIDQLRMGLTGAYLRFTPRWQPLEHHTADAWMRRRCGDRVYEALWRPLLVGKFGEYYDQVNMAWLWARLHSRTTKLGTFKGGFQAFMDRLADAVRARGVEIRLDTAVAGIRRAENGGIRVESSAGIATHDAVISTSSPALMTKLAPELPAEYAERLQGLTSIGAVVLVVTLDRKLTDYYWHSLPKEAGFPYLALVEHTNYMSPTHYGGDHIIYCGDYLDPGHEYFSLSKEELLERFLPSFKRFNPDFEPSWVKDSWLWKAAYAQPVPPVGHSRNIPDLRTPLPGLYFASMSQVYPWDRGTNYAVEIGRKVARVVADDLAL